MRPRTALFITTHPDDLEFFVGGTARWHVRRDFEVFLVIATTGEHDQWPFKKYDPERVRNRQEEARRAAAVLGIHRITLLNLIDRRYRIAPDAVRQLLSALERVKPDKVFAPPFRHPIERWIHDHKEIAWLTQQAMRQYQEPVRYFLYGSYRPNVFFDVTAQKPLVDRALQEHTTQVSHLTPNRPLRNAILRLWGRKIGTRYAEGVEEVERNKE